MRTNIVLDDELVTEAMKVTKARSKQEVVDLALRRLLQNHDSCKLIITARATAVRSGLQGT